MYASGTPLMASPAAPPKTARCPRCGCDLIDRMAREGLRDHLNSLFGRYPFRCRRCGLEFHLPQRGTGEQNQ